MGTRVPRPQQPQLFLDMYTSKSRLAVDREFMKKVRPAPAGRKTGRTGHFGAQVRIFIEKMKK